MEFVVGVAVIEILSVAYILYSVLRAETVDLEKAQQDLDEKLALLKAKIHTTEAQISEAEDPSAAPPRPKPDCPRSTQG